MNIDAYQETIMACRYCLMCRHACTVANVTQNDTNLPRGKALVLFAEQKKLLNWDERLVEVMYQCTNCHLCREWCVSRYDIAPVMLAARADIVEMGLAPEGAILIKNNLKKSGNPYGEVKSEPEGWRKSSEEKSKAQVLLYIGCTAAYRQPEIVEAACALLQSQNVDMTILKNEPCCGKPYYTMGYRQEAKVQAEQTLDCIRASGAQTVVTICPTCTLTFRKSYAEWGIELPGDIRFIHISEYLAEELEAGRLKYSGSQNAVLTFHDSCSLGRELGVYDAPRKILQAIPGVELREMRLNREHSLCCGNGGGVLTTNPEIAQGAGENAAQVILETSADILVTACPSCKTSLIKHVPGMEVLNIVELVQKSIK